VLAGFDCGAWMAGLLPKGTPDALVQKITERALSGSMETCNRADQADGHLPDRLVRAERRSQPICKISLESENQKWAGTIQGPPACRCDESHRSL